MARFVLINTIGNARAGAIFDDLQGDTQIIAGLTALGGVLMPLPNAALELAAVQTTTAYAAGGGDAIANGIMQAALSLAVGGGGGGSGPPNALAFYDGAGLPTGDANLTALPADQFGRPQIRDIRVLPGPAHGAVWRQGAWQSDGDPTNVDGEGIVIYGPAPSGLHDGSNGCFARVKPFRFGIRAIIAGVDIGYLWRVDDVAETFKDDTGAVTAVITRATGRGTFTEVQTGGTAGARFLSGAGVPNGVVTGAVGDLYTDTAGGAGTTLYVKESSPTPTTGWVPK